MTREEFKKLEAADQNFIIAHYNGLLSILDSLRRPKKWPGQKSKLSSKSEKELLLIAKRINQKLDSFKK